ncbi:E3 ubiquitin-protein ligase XIAP isoform X3 [Amia ocellicauda]|uniref:E3 ubiquitin-protein ligase XIAP isoform X3 n=1 Tax=Amia ocellicauda TaxID=2972642 RepID=UPI003463E2A0
MYIEYRQIMDVQNMEPASPASQDPDKSFEYDPKDWALQCHPFLNFSAKVVTQNYEHCLRRMVKGGQQGYNCKMRSELTRLKSFQGFSGLSPFTTEELANAGFFSLQQTAVVQCFNCGLIIGLGSFQPPRELHLKYREDCGFQKGLDVGNIDKYSVRVKVLDSEVKEVSVNCKVERGRFESFASWPFYCDTEPLILAECGFFYTGVKDYVQCFSCRGVLGDWEVGSDPWKEHAKWFPQCDYIRTRLSDSTISEIGRSYIGFHGLTGEHYISCIGKNGETQCIEATLSEDTGLNFFANKDLRMETFTQWPSDSPVSPSKLVQAGFFLTECVSDDGYEEVIQCFCCGGRISQWVEGADPVQEHCKLFPQCQFIANLNRTPQQSFTDPDVTKELNLHPETPVEELLFPSSELLLGQLHKFRNLQSVQLGLCKEHIFDMLPIGFSKMRTLRKLHLSIDERANYTMLAWLLKHFTQLSSFTLYCPSCPALLDILDSLPHNSLQELELGIIELTDAQLQHCIPKLGTFSNLKVLQISHEKFDNMEIMTSFGSVLRELRNLEVLHLPHGKGTEAVVESLITACQTLQGLRSLRIHSCLNDENLVRIAKATLEGSFIKLRELLLDWNICTTDRGWWEFFNTLGSLKELEKLSVSMPLEHLLKPSSSTVIAFVRAISQLPRVRHIIVAGWLLDQMDLDMFNAMKKKHPQSQNMILTSKICVNPHILVDD